MGKAKNKNRAKSTPVKEDSFNAILWGIWAASTGFCIQVILDQWMHDYMLSRLFTSQGILEVWAISAALVVLVAGMIHYLRINLSSSSAFVTFWTGYLLAPVLISTILFKVQSLGYMTADWIAIPFIGILVLSYGLFCVFVHRVHVARKYHISHHNDGTPIIRDLDDGGYVRALPRNRDYITFASSWIAVITSWFGVFMIWNWMIA